MKRIADMTPQNWQESERRWMQSKQEIGEAHQTRPQRAAEPYPSDDPWPSAPLTEPF